MTSAASAVARSTTVNLPSSLSLSTASAGERLDKVTLYAVVFCRLIAVSSRCTFTLYRRVSHPREFTGRRKFSAMGIAVYFTVSANP